MTIPVSASHKDGYKLDTITATAKHTVEETSGSGQAEVQGTYFKVSGGNYLYGWPVGSGEGYKITISSLANDNLSQILLTVGTQP